MNPKNNQQTIIPAPAGTKGFFETNRDDGSRAVYVDDVVALGFCLAPDELIDERAMVITPVGIAMDGSLAEAVTLASGKTYAMGATYPTAAAWLEAEGLPLVDQFTDEL